MSIYIGEVIKELRAKIGISQEELAHKSKLDRSYMGEIERNKKVHPTRPSLKFQEVLVWMKWPLQ
jgi:transcriptional regulator with XRE-family HTH domain